MRITGRSCADHGTLIDTRERALIRSHDSPCPADTPTFAKRRLGRTEIEVTPIGLGTWQFSEAQSVHRFIWSKIEPQVTEEIVAAALAGGINWLDTAEAYAAAGQSAPLPAP